MNRKSFLKTLGIGAAAAVVAPKVIAEIVPEKPCPITLDFVEVIDFKAAEPILESEIQKVANERLMQIFDECPEVAGVVRDIADGKSFCESLRDHFDADDIMPDEGVPDYEGWYRLQRERIKSLPR